MNTSELKILPPNGVKAMRLCIDSPPKQFIKNTLIKGRDIITSAIRPIVAGIKRLLGMQSKRDKINAKSVQIQKQEPKLNQKTQDALRLPHDHSNNPTSAAFRTGVGSPNNNQSPANSNTESSNGSRPVFSTSVTKANEDSVSLTKKCKKKTPGINLAL